MMYPRLALLRKFLREDGAIVISIDDNENANLIHLCDEIFGMQNRVLQGVWIKRVSPANDAKYFSSDHEFIIIYARKKDLWRPQRLTRTSKQLDNYRNPDDDPRGPWNSVTYTCNKSADERPNLYHGIKNPNTGEVIWPRKTAVWKYDAARHIENHAKGLVWWGANGKARMPRLKRFLSEMGNVVPRSFFHYDDAGHTQEARSELLDILSECPFTTPKASRLIGRIIELATKPGDLVLDSFAGSGTTGHAVIKLNAANPAIEPRRFLMVEMDNKIVRNVTAERVRRVSDGYTNAKGERIEGLGSGFQFCKLSDEPLFTPDGQVRPDVTFAQLAEFVWFIETGTGFTGKADSPLLGEHEGRGVYLLYNGIIKDKSVAGGNVLTGSVYESLPKFDGPKVIYAAACRLGAARLAREGIVFKQTPYALEI
jgi:site-specific DNA-methyltransferase (adenine-specific)/adenine-specific DNA-methyltransferase